MSTGKIGKSQIRPVSGLSPGVLLPVRNRRVCGTVCNLRTDMTMPVWEKVKQDSGL